MAKDKKGAKERSAKIAFVDESGFTERPPIRRTWAPRGKTPVIKHRFNWKRINAYGVIICEVDGRDPKLLCRFQQEPINKESVVEFLGVLAEETDSPLVVVWDNLTAHRSSLVKEHIEAQTGHLTAERLPAYAPELNPVEYLWSALKGKDLANFCADSIDQVGSKLKDGVKRIGSETDILRGFLEHSGLFEKQMLL